MQNWQLKYKIGHNYDCPANWSWQVDAMHDHDIWLVCSGSGRLSCDGVKHKLVSGSSFIFKPGVKIDASHSPDSPLQVIAVHFELADGQPKELAGGEERFYYKKLTNPEITAGILRYAMKNALRNRHEQADFWISAAVRSFFESESRDSEAEDEIRRKLSGICGEISASPEKAWNLKEIAGILHYSPDHCRRLFVQYTGVAPMEYVIQCRIKRACFLLKYTNLSLSEIAGELNYKTIYYFSRQFKKVTGIPPGQYRA